MVYLHQISGAGNKPQQPLHSQILKLRKFVRCVLANSSGDALGARSADTITDSHICVN